MITTVPRGIIVDLDGTLADTLPVGFDAYRWAFAKYVAHEGIWTPRRRSPGARFEERPAELRS